MRKTKVAALVLMCVCAALTATAQTHTSARRAPGWRRIVPARTVRAEVVRRLGKPAEGNASYSLYEFEDEHARVVYADGRRCAGAGGWNVPRGTVLMVIVTPQTELRASDLRPDLNKLKKEPAGDTPAHANYRDEAAGVTYEVFDKPGADYGRVLSITYAPAARYKRLRCPGAN